MTPSRKFLEPPLPSFVYRHAHKEKHRHRYDYEKHILQNPHSFLHVENFTLETDEQKLMS